LLVLLTNDDGIFAPGLGALRRHANGLGEVCVVAPEEQASGTSHSLNIVRPIAVKEARADGENLGHMVRGTPVDCVKFAVGNLLSRRPDVLISGINDQANFGISVLYSGTVAAAVEGALMGIHSVAVSMAEGEHRDLDYAAGLACDLAREAVRHPRPKPVLLNVNVPALPRETIRGVKWLRHNVAPYTERFRPVAEKDGWKQYRIHGIEGPREKSPADDVHALLAGYVTITPLRVDFTDHDELALRNGA
jgi:5'-nucleotidase